MSPVLAVVDAGVLAFIGVVGLLVVIGVLLLVVESLAAHPARTTAKARQLTKETILNIWLLRVQIGELGQTVDLE
jgi:hypothetical protein